ncbi:MAG: hypothetical protein V4525_11035 [Pseudomonadota bacterium]
MQAINTSENQQIEIASKFLENVPPGQWKMVEGFLEMSSQFVRREEIIAPDIRLFCAADDCKGYRFFTSQDAPIIEEGVNLRFITYHCRNCSKSEKIYSLWFNISQNSNTAEVFKFGEWPEFGPPIPPRVITLIGSERDAFIKGRRSENQGLGIGAFGYYRRVVENQKNRILEEIIRVSEKLGAIPEIIAELQAAQREIQFKKAIGAIKSAIPQALMINGHNPLLLLHSALSEGLHAQSDEECLESATTIRLVLTELADRLGQALKDEAELNHAVNRLMQTKTKK